MNREDLPHINTNDVRSLFIEVTSKGKWKPRNKDYTKDSIFKVLKLGMYLSNESDRAYVWAMAIVPRITQLKKVADTKGIMVGSYKDTSNQHYYRAASTDTMKSIPLLEAWEKSTERFVNGVHKRTLILSDGAGNKQRAILTRIANRTNPYASPKRALSVPKRTRTKAATKKRAKRK